MFDSIYTYTVTSTQFFIMMGAALLSGLLFSWIMSFKVRSTKRFFTVAAVLPFIVSAVITFVNGNIGAGVAIGGAFGLIRFRSAQGSSDELVTVLIAMSAGIAFGMGYIGYGVVILLGMSVLFFLLSYLPIYEHKSLAQDKLLRITIPESLEYTNVFDDTFSHYLKSVENVGVKTTGMGSMFRLSFKIQMKNPAEEKEFIDEIRTKNGNLEISVLPYTDPQNQL
ncbi:MAG: DUF4956 domain-containing protein [Alphaproteobacteria bacterium]|nr:DUF4956 domain-containing protein [Alphaproteobacteria bacterium]